MDVTPEAIREGRFREALRGYNREDVDEFLDHVASGVAVLQERLHQATERAVRAESQAMEAAEADESLRRTLVLAQRTADAAIAEARQQAAEMIADAEARRDSVVGEAERERERLLEDAHATARAEVARLHDLRERLLADVQVLKEYVDVEQERLRAALREQLRRLEEAGIRAQEPPAVHDVDGDLAALVPAAAGPGHAPQGGAPAPVAAEADDEPQAATREDLVDLDEVAPPQPVPTNGHAGGGHDADLDTQAMPAVDFDDDEFAEGALAREQGGLPGPREDDDDAVDLEDEGLPPPDEKARAFFDEDDGERGLLRRRRRRA